MLLECKRRYSQNACVQVPACAFASSSVQSTWPLGLVLSSEKGGLRGLGLSWESEEAKVEWCDCLGPVHG